MEQVKIFSDSSDSDKGFEELEQRINEWLKDHPNIQITARKVQSAYSSVRFVRCVVTIFYKGEA